MTYIPINGYSIFLVYLSILIDLGIYVCPGASNSIAMSRQIYATTITHTHTLIHTYTHL